MSTAPTPEVEALPEESSARQLWDAAVGKVFKLAGKNYGVRMVTYTQVKAVRDAETAGAFEIEVLCAEITARTISSKRAHSNICKEGVLQQEAATELLPESFGTECPLWEFEKVTTAILAYTNTYLDWVMQADPEEHTDIDVPIDVPHLKLTDMEASLVRNSPFLAKNLYFLTANSIAAAQVSIEQELKRALRGMLLADAVDAIYVGQKNEAIASLQGKLKAAAQEAEVRRILASVAVQKRDPAVAPAPEAAGERRRPGFASLQLDSLALALLGKPSATVVRWVTANPSEEGPVFCLGAEYAPLDFVRWAHVSGSTVSLPGAASRKLRDFFQGLNQCYTGPDREGIYPVLKPATE
ncbi:MAG: hypothetical protein WDM96_05500 [Lacunisphaera sp.]